MSTRGCVARLTSKEDKPVKFVGTYLHWDNYPDGTGASLFALRNGKFKGNTDAMLKLLIDEHPAGWSTINGVDWSLPIGYKENDFKNYNPDAPKPPQCFCHGDRSEEAFEVTEENSCEVGCEYAYAFTPDGKTMVVLSSHYVSDNGEKRKMIGMFGCGDPDATWEPIGIVDLDGDEPDWELMGLNEEQIVEIMTGRKPESNEAAVEVS